MTKIPRHLRQRSEFLTSLTKHSKKWTVRNAAILGMFAATLIGFLHFLLPLSANNALPMHQRARYQGKRIFSSPEEIPDELIRSLDAILVLGGGKPKSIDRPPVYVERRCDDAIAVVRRRHDGNDDSDSDANPKEKRRARDRDERQLSILCLSAGTAHMSQLLSEDGLPIWESTSSAAYILSKTEDIPPESIHVETSSYDTIGNAYFARTTHTDQNGWRKLLVVTNEFHMARTAKIFDWIFSVPPAAIAGAKGERESPFYELYYLESPNAGMTPEVVAARKEREASSSNSVDRLSEKYSGSLADVYRFLMREHALYAAGRLVARGKATAGDIEASAVNDEVKKSYGLS